MNIDNRLDQMFLKKLTVLYVDDVGDAGKMLHTFLCCIVGTLITAANGVEGMASFIKHTPDMVITGMLTPDMDGLRVACQIHGMAPTVPVFVITAYEQSDHLMRAINFGFNKYISRPVNRYVLFEYLLGGAHRLRTVQRDAIKSVNDPVNAVIGGGARKGRTSAAITCANSLFS
jgi:response regulator RpfG family c-di-GMP phosphodiesterase